MPSPATPSTPRILLYLLRGDLRLSDNPIFFDASRAATKPRQTNPDRLPSPPVCVSQPLSKDATQDLQCTQTVHDDLPCYAEDIGATHLLPVYVFPANQVEVSGFLPQSSSDTSTLPRSPYPEARSRVGGFWRMGPHRARFLAESVWDLKQSLERVDGSSGLVIRVGMLGEVVEHLLSWFTCESNEDGSEDSNIERGSVVGVCMAGMEGTEEKRDERRVRRAAESRNISFKSWQDEKYFVDDKDLPFDDISDLPNVYTTHRKSLEPLRSRPRQVLPTITRLLPLPDVVPPQKHPFEIPTTLESLKDSLLAPLDADPSLGLESPPRWPSGAEAAHPFSGGESAALNRLTHLITSGSMSAYKSTRNGMLGLDFSTKLSGYLAHGCLTARQIHWALVEFEEGTSDLGNGVEGYGKGENDGTKAVRFELLWRDYMRLCARKFGPKMFDVHGIQNDSHDKKDSGVDEIPNSSKPDAYSGKPSTPRQHKKRWRYTNRSSGAGDDPEKTKEVLRRFLSGRTGIGLIDASQRELFLTGYTSNRARQNVASFLASHLGIDWRLGAEWYECMLIDYDMPNNWGNWEYVAGVGNDPRQGRIFNPVKQALDYDKKGEYVKAWVEELRNVDLNKDVKWGRSKELKNGEKEVDQEKLMGIFQAWRLNDTEKERTGLKGLEWVEWPLIRIPFSVGRKGGEGGRGRGKGRGGGNRGRGKGRDRGVRRLGDMEKAGGMNGPFEA